MTNYMYILVILYNLNLLLNVYIEIMTKIITLFNYKNTSKYLNYFFFSDIIVYNLHKNLNFTSTIVDIVR